VTAAAREDGRRKIRHLSQWASSSPQRFETRTYRVEGLALGPSFELTRCRSSRSTKQKERKPSREGVSANALGPQALRAASQPRGASDDGAAGTTYRLESRVGRGHELLKAIVVPHSLSLRARESKRIFEVQRIVGGLSERSGTTRREQGAAGEMARASSKHAPGRSSGSWTCP
jgi:hypothetical protein